MEWGYGNMKIGIDISQIVYGTGVSKYTKNLVDALLEIDQKNEYVLFGGSLRKIGELQKYHPAKSTLKVFPLSPTMADFLWNRLHKFPIENFVGKIDVFHASDWTQPPAREATLVTTIHDLVPILFPDSSHPKIVAAHQRRLTWVKKEADMIIAVSEATKKDIIEHLGIPEQKIAVVYEASDSSVKKMGEVAIGELKKKYQLPKEYLLTVGVNPRKNIDRIIQAVAKIKDGPPLVVVGRRWAKAVRSTSTGQGKVIHLGHIGDDREFSTILSGASALVYASLYEGFGLPILDAFTCEVPVVTSNLSSMAEIAKNAAVLVNPYEIDDIEKGIEEALDKRKDLIKKGLMRVKQFSWEKAARETLNVYEEVVRK
ncbi:glycosyltransferase family 4 protein [Candidatus Microgenomates bacterium]|nr:glycosyltransferase family 4 protein [Candidatus Microgenomates bacterium]